MIISDSNGKTIISNGVNLHDDILKNLSFDRKNHILELLIRKENYENQTYIIKYIGVLGFQMTACDFWGKSPHILDFEYVEHNARLLLQHLQSATEYDIKDINCKLNNCKSCIETVLTFGSGDRLTVVCECIDIGQSDNQGTVL